MILAVDIGTSSMKGGLISEEGYLFSYHRVRFPEKALKGEFSAEYWSLGLAEICEALDAGQAEAVAISGNGPTMVAGDRAGRPLSPALLWHQNYSDPEFLSSSYYLNRIYWLKKNEPEIYNGAAYFLSCPEILYMQLTGHPVMVSPHDGYQPFLWDDAELRRCGLREKAFPGIVRMGSVAGTVAENPVLETALLPGTPVIACGSDFMASLIGTGAVVPGRVCDRAGTSEGINYCSAVKKGDSRLRELPHAVEGLTNLSAILSSTGSLFEWYRQLTGQEKFRYSETMEGVSRIPASQDHPFFFPSMKGENLWEFKGGLFAGLDPGQGKFELGRSVMEAIGFAVRRGLEIFEELDLPVDEIRISGGQAKSSVWNQMKADITGKTMLIPEVEDAELAGCACLAGVALGRFASIEDAAEKLVRIKQRFNPRPDYREIYDKKYKRYRRACETVLSFYDSYPAGE